MADEKKVQFKTSVSWAGDRFSLAPGDQIELSESTARARQDAGLGNIVKEKQ